MISTFKQYIQREFNLVAKNSPEFIPVYIDYLEKMKAGFFKNLSVFGQHFRGFDLVDAMIFSRLHTRMCNGEILSAEIEVGHEPVADRYEKENNEFLKSLPYPFSAKFLNGPGGYCDGWFYWEKPVFVGVKKPDDDKIIEEQLMPRYCQLEVGYTQLSRTFFHLFEEGCLARWPYHSNIITLLYHNTQTEKKEKLRYMPDDKFMQLSFRQPLFFNLE